MRTRSANRQIFGSLGAVALVIVLVLTLSGFANARAYRANLITENQTVAQKLEIRDARLEEQRAWSEQLLEYCDDGYGDETQCETVAEMLQDTPHTEALIVQNLDSYSNEEIFENTKTNYDTTILLANMVGKYRDQNENLNQSISDDITKRWEASQTNLKDAIESSQELLESSKDKVDSEDGRDSLAKAIKTAKTLLVDEPYHHYDTQFIQINHADEETENLESASSVVEKDVQKQKERLEREAAQREAERLAALRASQASATSNSGTRVATNNGSGYTTSNSGSNGTTTSKPSAPSASNSGNTWHLSVSACPDAWNGQSCVDGYGVTAIDFSPWGGPYWIGGHTGGAAGQILNFQVGDTVVVSGAGAGTYRVTGSTWIPKVAGQSASQFGTGFAFQTCSGNQMRLVFATRI